MQKVAEIQAYEFKHVLGKCDQTTNFLFAHSFITVSLGKVCDHGYLKCTSIYCVMFWTKEF